MFQLRNSHKRREEEERKKMEERKKKMEKRKKKMEERKKKMEERKKKREEEKKRFIESFKEASYKTSLEKSGIFSQNSPTGEWINKTLSFMQRYGVETTYISTYIQKVFRVEDMAMLDDPNFFRGLRLMNLKKMEKRLNIFKS